LFFPGRSIPSRFWMAFAVNRTMSYTRYFEAVDLVFSGATGEPGPNSSAPLLWERCAYAR
jgi:hypothetical protein